MIASIAFLNLKHVDLTTTRNQLILGTALVFGLGIPDFIKSNPGAINTGMVNVPFQTGFTVFF